jgi:hypothetical protein
MINRDEEFRKWYDARTGTKYESFAYDAWCAAWTAARKEEACRCTNPILCDLNDRCMRTEEMKND